MYEKYLSKYNVKRLAHSFQKYQAIKHSDYIIGVSKNTLDDILKYFPEFKNKKMQVIYHGISDDFYSIKKKQQFIKIQNQKLWNNSYFFYFGNRKGYKNFNLLVNAYSNLLKNNKNIPKLVVASGGKFGKNEKVLLSEMGISSSIIRKIN
jgi:mannosyltransferase